MAIVGMAIFIGIWIGSFVLYSFSDVPSTGKVVQNETRAKEARLDVGEPQRCPRDACWSRRAERVTRQDGQAQRLSKVDDFGVGGWRKWP